MLLKLLIREFLIDRWGDETYTRRCWICAAVFFGILLLILITI